MKKALFLTSALTLSLLAGCTGAPAAPAESTVPTESPAPVESAAPEAVLSDLPVLDWVADHTAVPDFLSPDQQQLYLQASCVRWIYDINTDTIDSFPLEDGSKPDLTSPYEVVTMGERDFFLSRGRYARWKDFSAMLHSIFTPSLAVQLLHSDTLAPTDDGRTAFVSAGRGTNVFYDMETPDSFTLLDATDDYIVFIRTAHYIEPMSDDEGADLGDFSYTQDYPIRLEHTAAGWRVAELTLPY